MRYKKETENFLWKVYYLLDPVTRKILYIGKSRKPHTRKEHFEFLYGLQVDLGFCQRFTLARDVRKAEKKAIRKHKPPYNIHWNCKNKNVTRAELGADVKYLRNKGEIK